MKLYLRAPYPEECGIGLWKRLTCIALAFKEKLLAPAGKRGSGQDLGCCGFSRVWGHILRDSSSTDVQLRAGNLGNFCLEHLT